MGTGIIKRMDRLEDKFGLKEREDAIFTFYRRKNADKPGFKNKIITKEEIKEYGRQNTEQVKKMREAVKEGKSIVKIRIISVG